LKTPNSNSRRFGLGLGGALVLGALAWWALRPAPVPPELVGPAAQEVAPPRVPAAAPPREPETTHADFTAEGQPIHPAGSAEVDAAGMAPHPITPQHERIFHENKLIGDLNSAMDNAQVAELRRLLQQYRDEYPEDAHVLQTGYEIIASCQEGLTAEKRAMAQRYYDEELDSGLRRYIRRYCLEAA
jgi:hypothetical protein